MVCLSYLNSLSFVERHTVKSQDLAPKQHYFPRKDPEWVGSSLTFLNFFLSFFCEGFNLRQFLGISCQFTSLLTWISLPKDEQLINGTYSISMSVGNYWLVVAFQDCSHAGGVSSMPKKCFSWKKLARLCCQRNSFITILKP